MATETTEENPNPVIINDELKARICFNMLQRVSKSLDDGKTYAHFEMWRALLRDGAKRDSPVAEYLGNDLSKEEIRALFLPILLKNLASAIGVKSLIVGE